MTDQQQSQRTMVFRRTSLKKPPDKPFEPPKILPIATMHDLEAQVDKLLATYLHNVHTQSFYSQVTKLIRQCPQSLAVITENTINSFKVLSRVHGLPRDMTPHLLGPLRDPSVDVQFRLKVAHTLKYCQEKSTKFLEGARVLQILEEYEKNLGDSPSFLERNLLSSLVQIVAMVVEQYDEATMTLLRRTFGMLNAEQKMDVRNLMESKGLWDAPLHPAGDASVSFLGSEISEDSDEMAFLSQNLKRSNVTTVTKDQQIDTVISEESEMTEMLSFNIQCTPWTTQEEASSFNVRLEVNDAPQLPRSNRNSSFWENLDRTLSWSSNKVEQLYQKARADQTSLTLEELEYLVKTFYASTFCKNEEPSMDRKIVDAFKLISTCVQLPEELLINLLEKASKVLENLKSYDNTLRDRLLEGVLEVAGNQCVMLNAEKFYPISSRLKDIDALLRTSRREVHGKLRDKIWTIFQHQASEEDMQKIIKDALDLLMDDQPHPAALDFIATRVRTGRMLTIEQGVVPAAVNVLKNVQYCQDQRQSAFQILQLHNSNPDAPLLTPDQIKTTLVSIEDWAPTDIPAFILRYLNKNPTRGFDFHDLLNTIWRVLNSCTEHFYLDGDAQIQAHLLLAIEKMATFFAEYRENDQNYSIATLSSENLQQIAQSLRVKGMINQNGRMDEIRESSLDQPHMLVSTIVAKILVDLCIPSNFSSAVLAEVSQTLNDDDEDKLTRIYCSEYFFKVSTFHKFDMQDLEILQKCTLDPISDIRIYSRVTYIRSLKEINVIPDHHVYHLPSIYAFVPVRFGCNDFTDGINSSILIVFQHVSQAVEFNVEMYKVLSHALDEMLQNPSDKLIGIRAILRTVEGSFGKMNSKDNTKDHLLEILIDLIEKIFIQLEDLNDDCCCSVVKLLAEGRWISPAIAKKCVDISRKTKNANCYIHCLRIAAELQDLPERIFKDFHVELVGKRFSKVDQLPELNHHQEAMRFLHRALESGHCLSESVMGNFRESKNAGNFPETFRELWEFNRNQWES